MVYRHRPVAETCPRCERPLEDRLPIPQRQPHFRWSSDGYGIRALFKWRLGAPHGFPSTDFSIHDEPSQAGKPQVSSISKPAAAAPADDQIVVALITDVGVEYREMSFVADRIIPIYESDADGAKVIRRLQPLEIAGILEIKAGWAKLSGGMKEPKPGRNNTKFEGWIKGDDQTKLFLIPKGMMDTAMLLSRLGERAWSVSDKHLIVRGVPRVGFTIDQVDMAMGKPLSATTEETATGRTELRLYASTIVTVTKGRVTKIVTTK